MVQTMSTTGTQRSKPWKYEIGEFQPWFRFQRGLEPLYVVQRVVSSVLYHFSIISPISLLFSLSITFIYSLSSIKRAKVENLYDPGSPCSSSPFADYLSSRVSRTITLSLITPPRLFPPKGH
ncbi:hypothetical protein ACN38_g867 [Penicillium nordicum]|uniref:Uncharacterized protein n=1 Tax=Penicillium nordicum TaxID=229535 RepID=A0A0M9WKC1_9EURO|nr:hypothetical protein ACN38_g867 [Penicillium nordicum]